MQDSVKEYPEFAIMPNTSYTALVDGTIVGVFGMHIMWPGVCELWLMLTKDYMTFGVSGVEAFYEIKKCVDVMIEENNIVRAQALARCDFPKAIKMLEVLGFQREGRLRKYAPDGCDEYRYALIREEPNGNDG